MWEEERSVEASELRVSSRPPSTSPCFDSMIVAGLLMAAALALVFLKLLLR